MYEYTIFHKNGKREKMTDDQTDVVSLLRLLDKCQIKSFSVKLKIDDYE